MEVPLPPPQESLPPQPPAAYAEHIGEMPGFAGVPDANPSDFVITVEAPKDAEQGAKPAITTSVEVADSAESDGSRMGKAGRLIGKLGVGELVDVGMRAAGVPLSPREVVNSVVDYKTFVDSPEEDKPPVMKRVAKFAGFLAINAVTGYAMQKGVPLALDAIRDNLDGGVLDTATQIGGKAGLMTGATSMINRRFGG